MSSGSRAPRAHVTGGAERRTNLALRELLDELLVHVRTLARHGSSLSQSELDHAQQRIEWLAEEIVSAAVPRGGE